MGFEYQTLLMGILIMLARVTDVSMGTFRTISIVHGRTVTAFFLGFFEISLWLVVISALLDEIMAKPILAVFYALGFSTGNVVGIKLEKKLAIGYVILRVISCENGGKMAAAIRETGHPVTIFRGEGQYGPVIELYIVCRRRELAEVLDTVKRVEPEAFYVTEQVGDVNKVIRPVMPNATGWRAVLKKK